MLIRDISQEHRHKIASPLLGRLELWWIRRYVIVVSDSSVDRAGGAGMLMPVQTLPIDLHSTPATAQCYAWRSERGVALSLRLLPRLKFPPCQCNQHISDSTCLGANQTAFIMLELVGALLLTKLTTVSRIAPLICWNVNLLVHAGVASSYMVCIPSQV
jgi:hypothetical protein